MILRAKYDDELCKENIRELSMIMSGKGGLVIKQENNIDLMFTWALMKRKQME